ncbi:MAG: radical SAM protein [Planctomycetota bacterium]|nr:MAG: radical SAM protein [Planctomycetota bacterium]
MSNTRTLILIPPSKFAKNVARDLVYGCWCKGKRIAGIQFPPLSLISVATVLKKDGKKVELLDAAAEELSIEDIQKRAGDFDIVVMLTSTMTLNEDAAVLGALKQAKAELKTIVFGGHVTAEPESTLERPGIDIVVRMEAEHIVRDLVRAFDDGGGAWKKIHGIAFKENGKVKVNADYPLIADLNELPIPDRTFLPKGIDYFNPIVKKMPYTTMFTSRGCPGKCTFCSSPTFYGRKIRYRSAESVLAEIEEIAGLGYKEIFFRDEIFTVSKKRVYAVCKGILKREIKISWICSSRIGAVDYEMIRIMKKAGCHMLRLGVETGVQDLLDNVRKGITVEQTRKTLKWANRVGIDTHAHMMIGMPGETKDTLKETFRFVIDIDPTIVTFGICTPYPGTQLFDELKSAHPEIGDGTQSDLSTLHTKSFYNVHFTSLTEEELQKFIRLAYRKFYLRPDYILKWLFKIGDLSELMRVSLAATQVLSFIRGKD